MDAGGIKGYLFDVFRTARGSFQFSGRSSRSEVLTYYFGSLFIGILIGFPLLFILEPEIAGIVGLGIEWLTCVPLPALLIRRLHDQDRDEAWAWLAALPAGYAATADAVSNFGGVEQRIAFDAAFWFLYWPAVLCSIAMLAAYLLPGTTGPNRFGPDPRGQE